MINLVTTSLLTPIAKLRHYSPLLLSDVTTRLYCQATSLTSIAKWRHYSPLLPSDVTTHFYCQATSLNVTAQPYCQVTSLLTPIAELRHSPLLPSYVTTHPYCQATSLLTPIAEWRHYSPLLPCSSTNLFPSESASIVLYPRCSASSSFPVVQVSHSHSCTPICFIINCYGGSILSPNQFGDINYTICEGFDVAY